MIRSPRLRWTLVLLLLSTAVALASESRTQSMGGTGLFMKDNSSVTLYPGSIIRYGNQIITELRTKGADNTFTAGAHLPMGDQAIFGAYLNRRLDLPVPGDPFALDLSRATDLLLGVPIGDKSLGVRVTVGFAENTDTAIDTLGTDLDEMARYIEFAGGVSSPYYDFSAFFGLPLIERTVGDVTRKWSGTGFGVSGRFFLGPDEGLQYVPVVVLNNFSSTLETGDVDIDRTFLEFRMAGGINYTVDERNQVIFGLELFGIRQDESDTPGVGSTEVRTTHLPAFYIGGETRPKSWLFLRLGAASIYRETRTISKPIGAPRDEVSRWENDFDVSVGLGILLGGFQLDLDINDRFLFQGPDFVSGQGGNEPGDFANRLSLTYSF